MGHGVPFPALTPVVDSGGEALLSRIYAAYKGMQSSSEPTSGHRLAHRLDERENSTMFRPSVPTPDASAPAGQDGFKFDRSGYRVPAIIVSPWVAEGMCSTRNTGTRH